MSVAPIVKVSLVHPDQARPDNLNLDFKNGKMNMNANIPIDKYGNMDNQKLLKVLFVVHSMKKIQEIINSDAEDKEERLRNLEAF